MPRLLLIAGLLVALAGCRARVTPGGATGSKPEQARKQAETLAVNAVKEAAEAQVRANPALARKGGWGGFVDKVRVKVNEASQKVTAMIGASVPPTPEPGPPPTPQPPSTPPAPPTTSQPKTPPRAGPAPILKERVVSVLAYPNEADAEKDALAAACDLLERRFAEFDPPLRYRPTENEVRNEFLRRDSRLARPLEADEKEFFASMGITGNLVRYEFDVEVTADQVRELRTRDRVAGTLRLFGGLTAVALAGFLFLRADEWTKGYLTRWLAVGAVLFAGGAAAALYFV